MEDESLKKEVLEDLKERVREIITPDKPLPDSHDEDIPVPPPPTQPGIRCGYYVGISEDGILRFDTIGSEPSLTDLLGLHRIAAEKINNIVDSHQKGKFSYMINKIDAMEEKLNQVLKIMNQFRSITNDSLVKE